MEEKEEVRDEIVEVKQKEKEEVGKGKEEQQEKVEAWLCQWREAVTWSPDSLH